MAELNAATDAGKIRIAPEARLAQDGSNLQVPASHVRQLKLRETGLTTPKLTTLDRVAGGLAVLQGIAFSFLAYQVGGIYLVVLGLCGLIGGIRAYGSFKTGHFLILLSSLVFLGFNGLDLMRNLTPESKSLATYGILLLLNIYLASYSGWRVSEIGIINDSPLWITDEFRGELLASVPGSKVIPMASEVEE